MREHMGLYRGKEKRTGKWIEGGLIVGVSHELWQNEGRAYIMVFPEYLSKPNLIEVDPDTVGECTGLTDKNGKLIFEGDLFNFDYDCVGVVIFKDGCFRMQVHGMCGTYTEAGYNEDGGGWEIVECEPIDWYYVKSLEIIGNIHDKRLEDSDG